MSITSGESLAKALEFLETLNQWLSTLINHYYNDPGSLQDEETVKRLFQDLSWINNMQSESLSLLSSGLELRATEEEYAQIKQEHRERLIAESASKPVYSSGREQ